MDHTLAASTASDIGSWLTAHQVEITALGVAVAAVALFAASLQAMAARAANKIALQAADHAKAANEIAASALDQAHRANSLVEKQVHLQRRQLLDAVTPRVDIIVDDVIHGPLLQGSATYGDVTVAHSPFRLLDIYELQIDYIVTGTLINRGSVPAVFLRHDLDFVDDRAESQGFPVHYPGTRSTGLTCYLAAGKAARFRWRVGLTLEDWAHEYADPERRNRWLELRLHFETGDRLHPTLDSGLRLDVEPVRPDRSAESNQPKVAREEVAEKFGTFGILELYWGLTADKPHVHQLDPNVHVPYDEHLKT
ncbi:hypothetical protein AB0H43_22295 [Hamadaea sp. NPDC050747]|uniref:hypothetical protein n=1 Tax=Hamadaea sp. NPDC050747 TaxID=3155789 RepID=UPI0033EC19A8